MSFSRLPPVTGKRQQQKLKTRETLLRTAAQLFAEQGFLEPSTIDIARDAGIAHGTLFVHFPTRDNLVAEVIASTLGDMAVRLHAGQKSSTSFEALIDHLLEEFAGQEKIYGHVLRQIDQLPSIARSTLLSIQTALSMQLFDAYNEQKSDLKLKSIRQDQLFIVWSGIVNHYILHRSLLAEGECVLRERKDEIKELFLTLLNQKG